jgi:aminopeptidase N
MHFNDILIRMSRFVLTLIMIFCSTLPFEVMAAGHVEQQLSILLEPAAHRLTAKTTITLAGDRTEWPELFLLAPRARIEAVIADDRPLAFDFNRGQLRVPSAGKRSALVISYTVVFDDPVPRELVGIEDPSYGVRATIMPEGTYLSASSGWYPNVVDIPQQFTITITGPQDLTGVTSGRLVNITRTEAGTVTTWHTVLQPSAMALAAGPYQLRRDSLGEIQLLTFFSKSNAPLAAGYLESVKEYLSLYQELFGPYPYEKFAIVENFYPTGYGLPGWTLLGSSVVRLPFIRTTSLPHEIAHAWWGNAIKVNYASGNWAEGLATYVADYYLKERDDPREALEYRRKILRDYAALVAEGDTLPLSAFRNRTSRSDQAVGYGKAAMVFHMLRDLIGDQAFWAGLQSVARNGLGKEYGWVDLQRHFEAVSSVDLEKFFAQWIGQPGAPHLTLAGVEVTDSGSGWQVSGSLGQNGPAYELAVPMQLITEDRVHEEVIRLTGKQQTFAFTLSEQPISLVVDRDSRLFRMLDPAELPATVNDLRASKSPLVVVASGSEPLIDASRDLLRGLQWHQAEVVDESAYLASAWPGMDVLFLGWPHSEALRPDLPPEVVYSDQEFMIGGKLSDENRDVLFMVRKMDNDAQVVAYFLPGSVAAARDTARRIPHYGRYSYLVFRDGQNRVKATWEPDNSPLQRLFYKDIKR